MVAKTEAVPSKYLTAEDIWGKEIAVTISHSQMERMGQSEDEKVVLYFVGKQKGVALNKTNTRFLFSELGGSDTDDWNGSTIVLFAEWKPYQGKRVKGISVKLPAKQELGQAPAAPVKPAAAAPARTPLPANNMADDMNDDIPF